MFSSKSFIVSALICRSLIHFEFTFVEEVARIHRRTIQRDLHDPENDNGVITHLEPDILECEGKWALESITMNKASGGDGIPVELFQILKMML